MCVIQKKKKDEDLKVRLGRGIKGAVFASSGEGGSEEVSEPQNQQTHIYSVKTWH